MQLSNKRPEMSQNGHFQVANFQKKNQNCKYPEMVKFVFFAVAFDPINI
jgi:hypothetical protein